MIAGAGFALMAWRLAQRRTNYVPASHYPSRTIAKYYGSPSNVYYLIRDRAWTAWLLREHNPLVKL